VAGDHGRKVVVSAAVRKSPSTLFASWATAVREDGICNRGGRARPWRRRLIVSGPVVSAPMASGVAVKIRLRCAMWP
jgi:hypothetical protein